jgi:hypothetical protein
MSSPGGLFDIKSGELRSWWYCQVLIFGNGTLYDQGQMFCIQPWGLALSEGTWYNIMRVLTVEAGRCMYGFGILCPVSRTKYSNQGPSLFVVLWGACWCGHSAYKERGNCWSVIQTLCRTWVLSWYLVRTMIRYPRVQGPKIVLML